MKIKELHLRNIASIEKADIDFESGLNDIVTGTPADGYAIRRVSAEPATLRVAGTDSAISFLNELHLAEFTSQQIAVNGLNTSVTRTISLSKTSDIVHFSNDTVMVTVEIAPK